ATAQRSRDEFTSSLPYGSRMPGSAGERRAVHPRWTGAVGGRLERPGAGIQHAGQSVRRALLGSGGGVIDAMAREARQPFSGIVDVGASSNAIRSRRAERTVAGYEIKLIDVDPLPTCPGQSKGTVPGGVLVLRRLA